MEITMKFSEARDLLLQLNTLASHVLPGSIKFAVYRNIEIIEKRTSAFYKVKKDLFKELGEPAGDDYHIKTETGDPPKENPNFKKYLVEIAKVDKTDKFPLSTLPMGYFQSDKDFGGDLRLVYKYLVK